MDDDDLSLESLAQEYSYHSGGFQDESKSSNHAYGGSMQFGYQAVPTYPAEMQWTPNTLPVSHFAPSQPAAQLLDAAAIASHFDFERAEAAGLVAATSQPPRHPDSFTFTSTTSADMRDLTTRQETRTFGGQRRQTSSIYQSQQGGETVVEPEPGRRIRLVPVASLPAMYRSLFTFPFFNAVQSICFPKVSRSECPSLPQKKQSPEGVRHPISSKDTKQGRLDVMKCTELMRLLPPSCPLQVLESGDNVVLSAPTGSGKTVVFELALVRMLTKEPENARAVYLAPTKALCSERTRDWSLRFGAVGCGITELTGDSVHGLHVARKSRLIVTTPEKWDSLTRKWDEQSGILSTIRLVLIDEVHILNEAQRGARLEVVVARTKNRGRNVRFVAVSATVPNLEDVAAWIGPNFNSLPSEAPLPVKATAEIFQFGEAYRPCPLQKHVYGYPKAKDEFAFQAYLNHKLLELVETHAAGRPCLVFCATRRSAVQAASTIAEGCKKVRENGGCGTLLTAHGQRGLEAVKFDDEDLQSLSSSRVAFHHAGLSQNDRRTVEQAFLSEKIAVLCCTTTLATGINLPAYCVIIRGTKQYEGQWCEMSELDLIQMMGRAGRPQFDRSGVAVIMCEDTMQAHYRELVSGSRDIESSLAPNLVEHVNAEIGLRGRTTEAQIEAWIRQSFMWIRLQKNPTYYLSQEEGIGLDSVEEILKHLCTKTLTALQEASLVSCSDQSAEIVSTEYGEIMSRFFIRHKSMLALMGIPEGANTRTILEAVSEAEEFGDQRMRQGEKSFLNTLRTNAEIRFPPRQIARVADKVSLLIQAHLSAINLMQLSKTAVGEANPYLDIKRIFPHATRIAKAAVDITIHRRDGKACKAALDLARSIAAGAWDGSPVMLRQIDNIGERSIKALANAGITTWQSLANTTANRIEMILNRNPPFGSKVVAAARSVPRIGLEVMQRSSAPTTLSAHTVPAGRTDLSSSAFSASSIGMKIVLDVTIRIENRATCMLKSKASKMALSVCILTLTSDGDYVDFRRMPIWRFDSEKRFTLHVYLEDLRTRILTYAACDEIAGTLMQANLLPVDMANGSHRTRIARAELHRGGLIGFGAESSAEESGGPSQRTAREDADEYSGRAMVEDEPDLDDEHAFKRCKHKCKGECRHVCCQRAREQGASGKPREFRFQERLRGDSSQSAISRYLKPFPTPPTSASTLLAQKRKAGVELQDMDFEDDPDAPQDLLSKLDRLAAETDRVAGTARPLKLPGYSRGDATGATRHGAGVNTSESGRPGPSCSEDSSRIRTDLGADAKASSFQLDTDRRNRMTSAESMLLAESQEHVEATSASAAKRPAQSRFTRLLGKPSWLSGSDNTG
ncbi:related to HFM1 - DNA/RNA helicase [Ustilago trichophora]|uniref:DNA 3'-5' helicase n=1 Tax=Ustilago trichophora TaxID=86804 RepID=A0A5C3ECG4_9BASI|nr:related to HFM1 - DNA/RNA helicase [Ustilago trichophora]